MPLILMISSFLLMGAVSSEKQMIVLFKDSTSYAEKEQIGKALGLTWTNDLSLIHGRSVNASRSQVEALKKNPNIEAICEDVKVQILGKPGKIVVPQPVEVIPWGITAIHADKVVYDGTNVKIGILDTGIDSAHPDLVGRVVGGKNFIKGKSYLDDNGHGTHVAGTISAINNDIGVVGVSPNVQLYALKALDSNGNGNISAIIAGLQWAVSKKLDIVNMSLGTDVDSPALRLAIDNAASAGLIIVAAAGNDGGEVDYPAAYDGVLGVAAIDSSFQVAGFSSHGSQVDISAPGVEVLSTIPGGKYACYSGTSMAAPHVTGTLALIIQAHRDKGFSFDYEDLLNHVTGSSTSLGDSNYYGSGLVNLEKAINTVN